MTGDDQDPSFDDPSYDQIRALLRDVRATGPLPDDVAARLDATLADLRRSAPGADTPIAAVVPLRRRVSRPRLLVAAAAVIIVGAGGGGLAITLTNQDSHAPASADATKSNSERSSLAPQGKAFAPLPSTPGPHDLSGPLDELASQPVGSFTTVGFAREAAAYAKSTMLTYATSQGTAGGPGTGAGSGAGSGAGTTTGGTTSTTGNGAASTAVPPTAVVPGAAAPEPSPRSPAPCVTPNVPGAQTVPITLDGSPATLVLHPAANGKQLVEAWSCDGTRVLASATVPA